VYAQRITKSLTSFDISTISHTVRTDVASSDVLDSFKDIVVLTNAADGNSKAGVEVTVFDQDIGTVGFHGNRVISIGDIPTTESDIIRIDNISAISVKRTEFEANGLVASTVHIDIFEKNVLAVDNGHRPHLRVDEPGAQEVAVLSSSDSNLMRSARAM
jgi:hypothetical protein